MAHGGKTSIEGLIDRAGDKGHRVRTDNLMEHIEKEFEKYLSHLKKAGSSLSRAGLFHCP
jgi:hypothetical protein